MIFLQKVFDENKKLDEKFEDDYNSSDENIMKMNIIELLVEIGEFCNETRCFKYWSNKKIKRDLALEEFADCIIMILFFFNKKNIKLSEEFKTFNDDLLSSFIKLYNTASTITLDLEIDTLKDTLSYLIHISELLEYSKEEIRNACIAKIKKNFSRFDSKEYGIIK